MSRFLEHYGRTVRPDRKALRAQQSARQRNPAVPQKVSERTIYALRDAIQRDPSLTPDQRDGLLGQLTGDQLGPLLLSGGLGLLVARWLKLSPTAQVLLSLAGLGIGKLLLDQTRNQQPFSTFNPRTRLHEIND